MDHKKEVWLMAKTEEWCGNQDSKELLNVAKMEPYPESFEIPKESDGNHYPEIHERLSCLQFNVHKTKKNKALRTF